VFFLVTGAGKRDVLSKILADPSAAARTYPVAAVRSSGASVWFVDAAALPETPSR
jgi:6-phosphogluconolactonase/glucosamine-6-phosphate isomerase/deaminase